MFPPTNKSDYGYYNIYDGKNQCEVLGVIKAERFVYHQDEVLNIINSIGIVYHQLFTKKLHIIIAKLILSTLKRDDIQSLRTDEIQSAKPIDDMPLLRNG